MEFAVGRVALMRALSFLQVRAENAHQRCREALGDAEWCEVLRHIILPGGGTALDELRHVRLVYECLSAGVHFDLLMSPNRDDAALFNRLLEQMYRFELYRPLLNRLARVVFLSPILYPYNCF